MGGGRGVAEKETCGVCGDDGAAKEYEFGGRGEGAAFVEELGEEGGGERGGQEGRVQGCWGEGCEVVRRVQVQGVSFFRRSWDRCRGGQEGCEGGLLRGSSGPEGAGLKEGGCRSDGAVRSEEKLQ